MVQTLPLALNYWAGNQFVPAPVNWTPTPKPLYQDALENPVPVAPPTTAPQPQARGAMDNGGTGYGTSSGSTQERPGSYNTGLAAGIAGSLAPVPGAGAVLGGIGTSYDTSRVNRDLAAVGLPGNLGNAQALLGNASFDLLGMSPQSYYDLMTAGVPYSALQSLSGRAVLGNPISLTPQSSGLQSSGSASQDFFNSINDLNNVGRLGDVLNELDASRGGAGTGNTAGSSTTGGGSGVSAPDQDGNASGLYAKGGKVTTLLGPNPPGPDDGYAGLDRGEHVIKKSAAKHYGKGILDAINEKKVDKKKLKGLLG